MLAFVVILLWCILAVYWSLGGSTFPLIKGDSLYRKIGAPIILGLAVWFMTLSFLTGLLIGSSLIGLIAAISYGVDAFPDKQISWIFKKLGFDPVIIDKGDCLPCEIATRAFCGLFWSLAGLWLPIMGFDVNWGIYALFCTIGIGVMGGVVKRATVSELSVGGILFSLIFFVYKIIGG